MIKLKLLLEREEPDDSDQWDDWHEYLEYFEYDINKDEVIKLINKHHLNGKKFLDGKILRIGDQKTQVYMEYDKEEGTVTLIENIADWIVTLTDTEFYDFGINADNIYNGHLESTLSDIKKNPGKVYHYTTPEGWEGIQKDGQMIGGYGSGINNRGAHGIFTTVNAEEYASGTYGDICLELNLEQFKIDNNLPELNLEMEPEVVEWLMQDYLFAVFEIENRNECPHDISPYTIIVKHTIPVKYIKQI